MEDRQKALKPFKKDEVIMRQGEIGDCAYIIEKGKVDISVELSDGTVQQLGTRGRGSIIGEMAIVDNSPRVATVIAMENCEMLEISRESYMDLLRGTDPIIQMVMQVILARYRDTLVNATANAPQQKSDSPTSHLEAQERDYILKTDAIEEIKIASEFKEALNRNKIDLHYQPIIDFISGEIIGFEALMRWNRKDKGPISPEIFIPIAEKSGLILDATKWALTETCAALKRIEEAYQPKGKAPLWISVNFSSTDFSDPDFIDNMYTILSTSDVKAKQLKLEITERLLIQQPENAKDVLKMCKDAGMSIAIDDFGTGYSSMSYLYHFPIDTLKIDRSFVQNIKEDKRSMELVKSMVNLGQNMEMSVIAEGVESLKEARILKKMGCDMAQGYYFARPMPEDDVIELLQGWKARKIST
jgi:EAL domain-containing protein (putative c-di-GMP-specific phosphodiesterase class I)